MTAYKAFFITLCKILAKGTPNFRFWAYFCNLNKGLQRLDFLYGKAANRRKGADNRHREADDHDLGAAWPTSCLIRVNVSKDKLLSRAWCNLIFEGRNKDYGAYELRRTAGRRYARALWALLIGLCLTISIPLSIGLYINHRLKQFTAELNNEFSKLHPDQAKEGHEFKALAAGRHVPKVRALPGGKLNVPDVVDTPVEEKDFGMNASNTENDDKATNTEERADSAHNADRKDLPEEGKTLTPTQVVEQMPEFPGGIKALMQYLDAHIDYPKACVQYGVQGDLEVSFLVDKQGQVREAFISRKLHPALEQIALKAVREMPQWKPGRSGGKVTIVQVSVTVHFQIK